MADINSAQSGNLSDTSTWVGGVVPGSGDTAKITHAVTVDQDTTSSFKVYGDGSITLAADVTFTQSAACRIGGDATGDTGIGTFTFGPGSVLDQGTYDTYFNNGELLSTATQAKQAKVTGSGAFSHDGDNSPYMYRRLALQYVSFLTTGVVDFSFGYIYSIPSVYELTLSKVLFKGQTSVSFDVWKDSYDVSLDTVHFKDCGPVAIKRQQAPAVGKTALYTNLWFEDSSPTGNPQVQIQTVAGYQQPMSNVYLSGYAIAAYGQDCPFSIDGLFLYLDKAITAGSQVGTSDDLSISNFYVRISDAVTNPHVFTPKNTSSVADGVFEVEYTDADDGDLIMPDSSTTVTVERVLSTRTSGLVAVVGAATANVSIDRCTVVSDDSAGYGALLKIENTTSYSGTATIKNSLHEITGGTDYVGQDTGGSGTHTVAEIGYVNTNGPSGNVVDPAGNISVTSAHDITTVAPQFVDTSRDLASWGSTEAAAVNSLVTISGYDDTNNDFNGAASGASLTALIAHVQEGFAPTNAALQGTGEGGVDIGAVAVMLAASGLTNLSCLGNHIKVAKHSLLSNVTRVNI